MRLPPPYNGSQAYAKDGNRRPDCPSQLRSIHPQLGLGTTTATDCTPTFAEESVSAPSCAAIVPIITTPIRSRFMSESFLSPPRMMHVTGQSASPVCLGQPTFTMWKVPQVPEYSGIHLLTSIAQENRSLTVRRPLVRPSGETTGALLRAGPNDGSRTTAFAATSAEKMSARRSRSKSG